MSILLNSYAAVRPLLFAMDAEKAHEFTLKGLSTVHQSQLGKQLLPKAPVAKPISLMGLSCRNRVGLAAGLDKNGAHIDALGSLGFGFLEVGTVTPLPQPGNPKPRLFRVTERQALVNRFGFNNDGLSAFLNNVKNNAWRKNGGILGLNIGKNALTPIEAAVDDYLLGLAGVYEHADYITINISSPNTQNLRELQGEDQLGGLLATLNDKRKQLSDQHQRYVPIAVKIAPDLGHEQIKVIADVLLQNDIDGVIATNTTLSRASVEGMTHAHEQGGLSGPPVHALSLEVIRGLRKQLGSGFPIIGVGGINTAQDAIEKIEAGAHAIQLYTGLIYQGPKLVHDCIKALDHL